MLQSKLSIKITNVSFYYNLLIRNRLDPELSLDEDNQGKHIIIQIFHLKLIILYLEADFLQFDEFDEFDMTRSEVDPYIDPDEVITLEDRDRILEMGRLDLVFLFK